MVDIWHHGTFYVLQFEEDFIGVSEITKGNPGFDTIPDEKFYALDKFKKKLDTILNFNS